MQLNLELPKNIRQNTTVRRIIRWSKKISIPGFSGVSVHTVVSFVAREISNDSIQFRAAATAFNALLATFPAILFVFTLIAYIPISNFRESVLEFLNELLPYNAQQLVHNAIQDIGNVKEQGFLLALGLLSSLYFASTGMRSLITAFHKATDPDFVKRKFLNHEVMSVGLTLLLMFIFFGSIVGIIIGKYSLNLLISWFDVKSTVAWVLLNGLKTLMIYILVFVSISSVYYLGPSIKDKVPWRFLSPGAILASIFSIITSAGFSYFVTRFGSYNKLYGSIGALMIIMVWFYIVSYVIIIGFELNASIALNSKTIDIQE